MCDMSEEEFAEYLLWVEAVRARTTAPETSAPVRAAPLLRLPVRAEPLSAET